MKPLSLQTLTNFCGGILRSGNGHALVSELTTDSRRLTPGQVFLALVGDRFDGHQYAAQVAAAGAAAVIVSRPTQLNETSCAVIEVPDTLRALQHLALAYRQWHAPTVIALTGSNGKTSTKDLLNAVLSRRYLTCATVGNLNNHIGLPLTLLSLQDGHEVVITEMGMNHAGEIKTLTDIALPDAGIVTNIGRAHIEHLGTQDNIAWEKATLPANVHAKGVVVLNANDDYTDRIARHCQAPVFTAGISAGDVSASNLRSDATGTTFTLDFAGQRHEARLALLGTHMVANAALAACMGWQQGVAIPDILAALAEARLSGGRLEPKQIRGIHFLDDSYNANPDSMIAGLQTLAATQATRRFAVLGPMGELGQHAADGHAQVGRTAATLGLDGLFTVGGGHADAILDAARRAAPALLTESFPDHAACAARLHDLLNAGDTVLLKGSRSAAMEKILTHFQDL